MRELLQLSPKLPLKLRLLLLAPRTLRESPFRGAEMAQWLFSALEGMDEGGSQPEQLAARWFHAGRPSRPVRHDH